MDLGRYGLWRRENQLSPELAQEVERLGFGAIWIGSSPGGRLQSAEDLLRATERIVIATGIVNMWTTRAEEVAESYHRFAAEYPDRFLLGVGVGHRETNSEYRSPYATIVEYLDRLDENDIPASGRVLAALGPKVLRLAAERAAGAHPYFTTPEHTRRARELLGAGPLLAPEQKIVLDPDPERGRAIGRPTVAHYLARQNYVTSLKRLGWANEDLEGEGSDAIVDVLAVHGGAAAVAGGLMAHLDAGADHVVAQVLTADNDSDPVPTLRAVADILRLGPYAAR